MDVAIGERELGQAVEEAPGAAAALEPLDAETPERASPGLTVFRHLAWALAWGVAQWLAVALLVSGLGWERLPYDTIGEVGVWVFLAINASAWIILTYSLYRYRKPLLWFWWAACFTWWLTILIPYQQGHTAFRARLRESEAAGLRLARRIDAYRRERGHLPRKVQDVAQRDGQPIADTAFGKPIRYQISGLNQYALVIEAGDKNYCYSSRHPRQGFVERYFDGTGS